MRFGLPDHDRKNRQGQFENPPTGPWVAPPRAAPARPSIAPPRALIRRRQPVWSAIVFALLMLTVGVRAYRDLSRPEAWAYWKESYFSPSMTSSVIASVDLDGVGHHRAALAVHGTIGAASASWLRERLDGAHLGAGDIVLLSSPGGNLDQALIMGEVIRSRGLATGRLEPRMPRAVSRDPIAPARVSSSMPGARPVTASKARRSASIASAMPIPGATRSPKHSEPRDRS